MWNEKSVIVYLRKHRLETLFIEKHEYLLGDIIF